MLQGLDVQHPDLAMYARMIVLGAPMQGIVTVQCTRWQYDIIAARVLHFIAEAMPNTPARAVRWSGGASINWGAFEIAFTFVEPVPQIAYVPHDWPANLQAEEWSAEDILRREG